MKYKLVIFDCDGVIADSEPISTRLFTDMVNELGLNLLYEESGKLFTGRSDKDCKEIVETRLGSPMPAEFIDDFNSRLLVLLETGLTAVKNVEKVLDLLQGTTPICVASNAPRNKVKGSLRITELGSYFNDNIFTVDDVKRGKPFPDLYLLAAEKMGIHPHECAVIEDSVYGARAGIAAGMTVFGYAERSDEVLLKNEGAVVFNDMLDLPELLLNL